MDVFYNPEFQEKDWGYFTQRIMAKLENKEPQKLVKTPKIKEFEAECALMSSIRPHPNVVLLLGVTRDMCLVTDLCSKGSLESYSKKNKPINNQLTIKFINGIAKGMLHLVSSFYFIFHFNIHFF